MEVSTFTYKKIIIQRSVNMIEITHDK